MGVNRIMDKEIYLLLVGAAIAFISSIGTYIVTELFKFYGKIKLYYKITYSKMGNNNTWGFYNTADGENFSIPLWIEILNTSNVVCVIRDLNIILFNKGKEVAQMTQINKIGTEILGNEGAYSFVLQPRSIMKYTCNFCLKKNEIKRDPQFDEIRLRYFDTNDKAHIYRMKKIDKCWELGNLEKEGKWQLAKK